MRERHLQRHDEQPDRRDDRIAEQQHGLPSGSAVSCGLHVTALGVTTTQHITALTGLGCDAAQGRHLVPPLTAAALRDYLLDAPTKPAAPDADVIPLHTRRRSSQH